MEFVVERTIDELGRIIVPKEARQAIGWDIGTKIAVYVHNDTLVLKACNLSQEQEAPSNIQQNALPH